MFTLTHIYPNKDYNLNKQHTYLFPDSRLTKLGHKWELGTIAIEAIGHSDKWLTIDQLSHCMNFYEDKAILDSICDKFLSFKEKLYRLYHIKFLPIRPNGSREKITKWVPYPGKDVMTTQIITKWKVTNGQLNHYKKAKYYDKIALLRKAIRDKSYEYINSFIKNRKILITFYVPTLYKVRCVSKSFRNIIDKNYLPSKVKEVKDILDCKKAVEKTSYFDYLGDTTPLNTAKRVVIAATKVSAILACPTVFFTGISLAIPMVSFPLFASISIGGGFLSAGFGGGTFIYSMGKAGSEFRRIQRAIANEEIKEVIGCDISQDVAEVLQNEKVFGNGADLFCAIANSSYAIWKAKKINDNLNQEDQDIDNEDLKCPITWNTMRIPAYVHHSKSAWDYEALKQTITQGNRDPNRQEAKVKDIKLNVEKFNELQLLKLGEAI